MTVNRLAIIKKIDGLDRQIRAYRQVLETAEQFEESEPLADYIQECIVDLETTMYCERQFLAQEDHRRAMERDRMIQRSRANDAAARAGDIAEKRKVMGY
jgi:hypothetical protein